MKNTFTETVAEIKTAVRDTIKSRYILFLIGLKVEIDLTRVGCVCRTKYLCAGH